MVSRRGSRKQPPRPRQRHSWRGASRRVEARELVLALAFLASLVIWLFIGVPLFNGLGRRYGVVASYSVFMALWVLGFGALGAALSRGRRIGFWLAVSFATFVIGDVVIFPILVPYGGATELTPEQAMASDVYFYSIYRGLGLPHTASWVLSYIATPFASFLLVVYSLRYGEAKRRLRSAIMP